MNYYLGVDIGSISTKGVIINDNNEIVASTYLWTKGSPIEASKRVIEDLHRQVIRNSINICAVGTTGSARQLIGTILNAAVVKNEITAHAIGTITKHPDVRSILEIGGQDSKIILIKDKIVIDYAMNTICAAGTGSFLSSQAKRLDINVEDMGKIALSSKNPTKIAARCTVFAESDLVHKAQIGHSKQDIIAGLCYSIANNYLNNVGKGKKIFGPIVFQGGVSKNIGVVKAFEDILKQPIITDSDGHLMGAYGAAILAKESGIEKPFDFKITNEKFETKGFNCNGCPNNCEIIYVKKDNKIIDSWGNRCEKGQMKIATSEIRPHEQK